MKTGNALLATFFWSLSIVFPALYLLFEKYELNSFFNELRLMMGMDYFTFSLTIFLMLILLGLLSFITGIEISFRKKEKSLETTITTKEERTGEETEEKPTIKPKRNPNIKFEKESFPESVDELNELFE